MNAMSPLPYGGVPASVETEQGVIGTVLLNPGAIVSCRGLRAEHFIEPAHAAIWQRIVDFNERGELIEARLVSASFTEDPLFEGGPSVRAYIGRMIAEAPTISGVGYYSAALKEMWALRSIAGLGGDVLQSWGGAVPKDLLNHAFERIETVRADLAEMAVSRPREAGDVGKDILSAAQDRANGGGERPPSTGLPDLDARLPLRGLAPGSLLVIAGRTGMGKSMLLSSMARQAARHAGVVVFSLEVGAEEMSARMLADIMGNGPTYEDLLSGALTDAQMEAAHIANRELCTLPIMVDPSAGLTMGEIERKATSYAASIAKRDIKLGLVVIDHAQIVKASTRYQGNRVGELGEIANMAKVVAKRLNCCVALASQVNRSVEGREDKRPTLSDLRASGEIEEAADCIGLLYRPAYYVERSPEFKAGDPGKQDELDRVRNQLEFAIDKSRQGRTGVVNLWCDPGRSIVRCLTPFERHAGERQ